MNAQQISVRHRKDAVSSSTIRMSWHDLAHRFIGERECLASYLALEAAEVIGGAKPANLINLVDQQRPCGRNLYRLWRRHGQQLLAQSGLVARELVQRNDGVLLLIYHPERLAAYLETPKVANFLQRAGYRQPADLEQTLQELQNRCLASSFPHEIGAILGYPLKDVAGFMGWLRLPVTHQGPWKIYGDPRPSLAVVDACRGCRNVMARRLLAGASPFECLCNPEQKAFPF
ncbi:MAG: DUF3793 family protein [Desulfuromonadales bacterium]|nr:DUF3793 family protein [Desulfuromonadales bacterium]